MYAKNTVKERQAKFQWECRAIKSKKIYQSNVHAAAFYWSPKI